MQKTEIYVARHGQTIWNARRLFQGQQDIELSELGIEQAQSLGERLADIEFDCVYTSHLIRTQQTARYALQDQQAELLVERDLSEIDFGDWEGENIDDFIANRPEEMKIFYYSPDQFVVNGMERTADFVDRVITIFEQIIERHRGQKILIVAHGGVLNALKFQYMHKDLKQFWTAKPYVKPTALAILEASSEGVVFKQLPDASHWQGEE